MSQSIGQLCTFSVGGLRLAVDVLRVQEVLRPQPMTRVPRAPEVVLGLINLRGQIVTAIDLGRRLGLPGRARPDRAMNIIIQTAEGAASLLVDQIGDVQDGPVALEPAPSNTPGRFRALLRGVAPRPGHLLLVLDPDAVLTLPEASGPADPLSRDTQDPPGERDAPHPAPGPAGRPPKEAQS